MGQYICCGSCGRQIAESTFHHPSAHAPGCSIRRSLLAKAGAAERKAKAEKKAARKAVRGVPVQALKEVGAALGIEFAT